MGKKFSIDKRIIWIVAIVIILVVVFSLYLMSKIPEENPYEVSLTTTTSSQFPLFNNVPDSGETPPVPPS